MIYVFADETKLFKMFEDISWLSKDNPVAMR